MKLAFLFEVHKLGSTKVPRVMSARRPLRYDVVTGFLNKPQSKDKFAHNHANSG